MKEATLCFIFRASPETGNRQVLLIEGKKPYSPHYQKLNGLGGRIEDEDKNDRIAACCREVKEEGGIQIHNPIEVGVFDSICENGKESFRVYCYRTETFDGEVHSNIEEGEVKWYDLEGIEGENIIESLPFLLDWIESGEYFDAVFRYSAQGKMTREVRFRE